MTDDLNKAVQRLELSLGKPEKTHWKVFIVRFFYTCHDKIKSIT